MSVALDAHVAGLDQDRAGVLACIDSNVPTSPRSVKKQRLITDCRSPATPLQPHASPFPSAVASPAAADPPLPPLELFLLPQLLLLPPRRLPVTVVWTGGDAHLPLHLHAAATHQSKAVKGARKPAPQG